jgi:membrane protease YdiL (CAAX protease family)
MVLQSFVLTCLVMLGNSYVEEATSRAFPIQVLRRYSALFRIFVPTLFFAIIHLADEKFSVSAFYSRIVAGVALSLGYFATGNVWLASGLHTGWNFGETWADGNWTAVAAVSVDGEPLGPAWIPNAIWTLLVIGASVWLWRRVRIGSCR